MKLQGNNLFYCLRLGGLKPPDLAGSFSISLVQKLKGKSSHVLLHSFPHLPYAVSIGVGIFGHADIFAVSVVMLPMRALPST